jgi:hypothetical protein
MPGGKKIFPPAILGTRAIGSSALNQMEVSSSFRLGAQWQNAQTTRFQILSQGSMPAPAK